MGSHIAPLLPNDSLQDMLVGAVSEQVTVQAEAELIQTRTAAAGQLVDEKRIIELPLNGRRPERLVYLADGTPAASVDTAACIRGRKRPV